ncbi:MAG: NFACT RNA binding domain-containing protein, partial [Candidatus Woesearchaeota archaeon]
NLIKKKINFLKNNLNILKDKKIKIDNKNKEKIIKTNNFEIRIKINKKIENKIDEFYNKIKKLKSKIEGAKKTIETLSKKEISKTEILKKIEIKKVPKWYEKFRWFYTKENNLVIGGRDATTNEILIKKYMEKEDLVFHTIEPGSPFFLLKSKNPDPSEINDVAIATASYSKQWSNKFSSSEVFYVKSEQVSKNANPGEFLNKGSFMIRGKKNFLKVKLGITIGNFEGSTIGGPFSSINNKTKNYVKLTPGFNKKSDIAKKISKKLKLELDEIMKFLPNGTSKIL